MIYLSAAAHLVSSLIRLIEGTCCGLYRLSSFAFRRARLAWQQLLILRLLYRLTGRRNVVRNTR